MAVAYKNSDLVSGALALAYAYVEVPDLVDAYKALSNDKVSNVLAGLRAQEKINDKRVDKLNRATRLMALLHDAAIYGTVALQNKLIGEDMLNACMEENRRKGFQSTFADLLLEKGVITTELEKAITKRCEDIREQISQSQVAIQQTIDFGSDDKDTLNRKFEILLGEVASKLAFLDRKRLDDYLTDEDRVKRGLSVDAPVQQQPAQKPPETPEMNDSDPIKGYEIQKKLGQGAMGAVYRAVRKATKETVALKVLKPDLSNDQEFVQRFLREAKAVARLNHQNVIRAVDVGKSGKYYYFAMEFVDGQSVNDILKREKTLPERACLKIVKQIALALDHAWKHKIIHRDVKPDNIMVMKGGIAKLTDLGLARSARESTLTLTGVVMGSPAYISPEQATGEKNLDARSDIYSLGATLYHMLTGVVPYDGDSPLQVMLRHMNDPLPDARLKVPTVSEGTRQLIFKMMAKRAESRFQNARQLYDAIVSTEKLLAGASVEELSRSQVAMRRSKPGSGSGGAAPKSGKAAPTPSGKTPAAAKGKGKGKGKSSKNSELRERMKNRNKKKRRI